MNFKINNTGERMISSKKQRIFPFVALWAALMLQGCGEGVVEIENISYEPRVSIEGFLTPGEPVTGIRLYRNFKLDQDLREQTPLLDPLKTSATITDEGSGVTYPLSYRAPANLLDISGYYYEYRGSDLTIVHGGSYTLEVRTEIDGTPIEARSTTTVPAAGFRIAGVNYDSLQYRQKTGGELVNFVLDIDRAPGTTYYLASILSLTDDYDRFVSSSPFGKMSREEFEKDKERFVYNTFWIQNTPPEAGRSIMNLFWFEFHFYGRYRIIVYAADKNYREFMQTYSRVQEIDGNFHEARFNIEGQGIGVFGSVIPDTVYVTVTE